MACIFYLILVVIFHPAWYCPFKNREVGVFLLNGQNLLSMTKVICWRSLNGKVLLALYFQLFEKMIFVLWLRNSLLVGKMLQNVGVYRAVYFEQSKWQLFLDGRHCSFEIEDFVKSNNVKSDYVKSNILALPLTF